MNSKKTSMLGRFAATWGVLGVVVLLSWAVYRLSAYAWEAMSGGLSGWQWSILVLNVVFMAWSEGYRGFQRSFSPRVAARAFYLQENATPVTALLAPVFCLGYFKATRRALMIAWVGALAIICLILLVQLLSQPWRGIVDAGVVVGLTWGIASFLAMVVWTFAAGRYIRSPEVPGVVFETADAH